MQWRLDSNGRHGKLTIRDLGITLKMRGQAKEWGKPSTLTIVYKPGLKQWFASITVELSDSQLKRSADADLNYESMNLQPSEVPRHQRQPVEVINTQRSSVSS